MTHISKLFKAYRLERELSQAKLAAMMGYRSPQFISNIERREAWISPVLARKIAKALKIPERDLADAIIRDLRDQYINKLKSVKRAK